LVRDLPSQITAALFLLGETHSAVAPVSITRLNDSQLEIMDAPQLALGCPVKVLQEDCLWLGEVIACRPDGSATIRIVHLLRNISELRRLADRFTGCLSGGSPAEPQPEPTLS
jgi:hypothetical protein